MQPKAETINKLQAVDCIPSCEAPQIVARASPPVRQERGAWRISNAHVDSPNGATQRQPTTSNRYHILKSAEFVPFLSHLLSIISPRAKCSHTVYVHPPHQPLLLDLSRPLQCCHCPADSAPLQVTAWIPSLNTLLAWRHRTILVCLTCCEPVGEAPKKADIGPWLGHDRQTRYQLAPARTCSACPAERCSESEISTVEKKRKSQEREQGSQPFITQITESFSEML